MLNSEALTPIIVVSFIIGMIAVLLTVVGVSMGKRRFSVGAQAAFPLAIVAIIGTFVAYRFNNAGKWYPELPDTVGDWRATDTPIPKETLSILLYPHASAHEYMNRFGETVFSTMVSAGPFANYHDPTVCVVQNGFSLTAKKIIPMQSGDWKVRALIFKRENNDGPPLRIMMYYWTQTRRGNTGMASQMGNFRDVQARLETGYSSVIKGEQNTILRIYAIIPPDDPNGVQTQRNLNEISRATYEAFLKDGRKSHD